MHLNHKLDLVIKKFHRSGILGVTKASVLFVLRMISPFEIRADLKRKRIGLILHSKFNGQIRYGSFKGVLLPRELVWAKNDLASMLIGFYEQQVVDWIVNTKVQFHQFVDVGSADGFYLAGILGSDLAETAIGFESSQKGQESSRRTLELNNLQNRCKMFGTADTNFLKIAMEHNQKEPVGWSLLMCDIEGGELHLFNSDNVELMRRFFLIIELHEWTYSEGDLQKLENIFLRTHNLQYLRSSERNPSSIKEINNLSDDIRWSLCSEGRRHEMRWLVGIPRLFKG